MKAYLLELRNSSLKWWFPFFVITDLAAVFGRSRSWIGVWPQASVAAQIPSLFFAPLLIAAAAWAAGRVHRNGLYDQLRAAALPAWRIDAVHLAVTTSYGLAAYLVGAVAAAAISFDEAGPGFLWPGYIILGACVIVASAAIGHAVGALFHSSFATPAICGLGLFVALGTIGRRAELFVLSGPPQVHVSLMPLLMRLTVALGLTAVAVFISQLGRVSGSTLRAMSANRLPLAMAFAISMLSVVGVAGAGRLVVDRPAPEAPVCTSTSPKVCLWPENRKYLPMAAEMMARLNTIPAGLLRVPDIFFEEGLRDSRYSSDFFIAEGNPWSMSSGVAATIQQMTYPPYCTAATEAERARRIEASFDFGQWLESRLNGEGQPASVGGGRPGVDRQAIAVLLDQPDEVQLDWARERLETIRRTRCEA